jgi:chromosomal replication initiator protein
MDEINDNPERKAAAPSYNPEVYEKNKQIILSSDKPPKAIPALAERLRSRFEGGMIGDISYPDYETRLAILKMKMQERGVSFLDDVLDYIATNIQKI